MERKMKTQKTGEEQAHAHVKGITILLVVLVITVLLAISVGIFTVVYTEYRLAGELKDSFFALNASDSGLERAFYCARVPGSGCSADATLTFSNNAGASVTLTQSGPNVTIVSTGEYPRNGGERAVRRSLQASYRQ